ncbi:putative transmembrane protein [Liberibacter crescens BT-1]|uniref:Putative transmembrane protein n=1 Tax=Liberibacter crescens (strain BT-1) TaxID=1215343 RepID=L0EW99_LIBCB|nr:DUF2125 domain-containing protein [Liberibacter crescens]AGA65115.1 putative transmembrane protein [Liberibacter crescens BT-1]AMC13088.1 hypothetical protein RL73_05695 [Liberibacter crescens]
MSLLRKVSHNSKFQIFMGFIIASFIITLIYIGLCLYTVHQLKNRISSEIIAKKIECTDLNVQFSYFTIILNCSQLAFKNNKTKTTLAVGGLKIIGSIFNPQKISWNLQSPAKIYKNPQFILSGQWESFSSKIENALTKDKNSLTVIEQLKIDISSLPSINLGTLTIKEAKIGVKNNNQYLAINSSFDNTNFISGYTPFSLSPFSIKSDVLLFQNPNKNLEEDILSLCFIKGEVKNLTIDFGDNRRISFSGPFSCNFNGLISANIHIEIENFHKVEQLISESFPIYDQTYFYLGKILEKLSRRSKNDTISLKLNIYDGFIKVGFIPLGTIPPLK